MTDTPILDMKTEERSPSFDEVDRETKQRVLEASIYAITGERKAIDSAPSSQQTYLAQLHEAIDSQLEGHLEELAKKQGKDLQVLPTLAPEATAEEKLQFLKVLTSNIHAVQGNQYGGITPYLSRELNGMDCSMSTWVMAHEAKKAGLRFEFGLPPGHAVGIVTIEGKTYYADGQKGFVEEIDTEVIDTLPNGARVMRIKNATDINNKYPVDPFPQTVMIGQNNGIAAALTNFNSMLLRNGEGDLTDEEQRFADTMKPFADPVKDIMGDIGEESPINQVEYALTPEQAMYCLSEAYKEDIAQIEEYLKRTSTTAQSN